jgi:hypothetical protein
MREKQEPRLALPHSIAKRYRFSSFCLVERLNGLARGTRTTAPVRARFASEFASHTSSRRTPAPVIAYDPPTCAPRPC